MLPYSPAADRNKAPILETLLIVFKDTKRVLELGSGTGQHAVYFSRQMPHLIWQPSEVTEMLPGLTARLQQEAPANTAPAIRLDVGEVWPALAGFDGAYTANTFHIVSQRLVIALIEGVGRLLPLGGCFAVYGPFNQHGEYTSDGNAAFDRSLRFRDPESGIRDLEWVAAIAAKNHLTLTGRHDMPANNMLLGFVKTLPGETVPSQ